MCHESPASSALALIITMIGSAFCIWHIYSFDHGACLIPSKREIFRCVVIWMILSSLILFVTWDALLVYIKYKEGYGVIPLSATVTEILPVPWSLWDAHKQDLARASYHCLSVAWALILSIHAEETLYWMYLIRAIRNRDSTSWFHSVQFKVWILCVVLAFGIMLGVAQIETANILQMEENLFMAGSIFAIILLLTSLWLVIVFPSFIRESIKQGANSDVVGRLQYFKELNLVRTVLRAFYAGALATLAFDGMTHEAKVNHSEFWLDICFIVGIISIFCSTAVSIMIFLPRSMAREAGLAKQTPVFVQPNFAQQHPYNFNSFPAGPPSTTSDLPTPGTPETMVNPWGVLGERLNLDKVELAGLAESQVGIGSVVSERHFSVPFAARPGARILHEGEHVDAPIALNNFRSPADNNAPHGPVDLSSIVVTTQTVVEKE